MKNSLIGLSFAAIIASGAQPCMAVSAMPAASPRYSLPMRAEEVPTAVPGKAENVTVNFPKGSLSGTIEFDVPANMRDGKPGVGDLFYDIKDYSDYAAGVLFTGTCEYGTHCVVNVTFDAPCYHAFTVYLRNSKGNGTVAPSYMGVATAIGPGTPEKPTNVRLTASGNTLTLSWNAVTEGTGNGNPYVDPAAIT